MDLRTTTDAIRGLVDNVEQVITGKRRVVEMAAVALFAGQHVLIDDVPGIGKTTLARALARSVDGSFKRVQGTPDLLPSDITGGVVFDQRGAAFVFVPGPVFANVVLFDEINRASPKTQSALLEVMEEGAVSADGDVHQVPHPFLVVATRNPVEHHGTFPLPEGELDRFGLALSVGYPDAQAERDLVRARMTRAPLDELEPVIDPAALASHQDAVRTVHVDDDVLRYAVELVRATREEPGLALGASPRASLSLVASARAFATLRGRDHVLPDDVKALAPIVLAHRIVSASDASAAHVVDAVVGRVAAPVLRRVHRAAG